MHHYSTSTSTLLPLISADTYMYTARQVPHIKGRGGERGSCLEFRPIRPLPTTLENWRRGGTIFKKKFALHFANPKEDRGKPSWGITAEENVIHTYRHMSVKFTNLIFLRSDVGL